jgi:hypothetical protein
MSKSCNYCLATNVNGKMCKNLAACNQGCNYFCKLHAKFYGGEASKTTCDEKLENCSETSKFPCKLFNTVFMKRREYESFLDLLDKEDEKESKKYENYPFQYSKPHKNKSKFVGFSETTRRIMSMFKQFCETYDFEYFEQLPIRVQFLFYEESKRMEEQNKGNKLTKKIVELMRDF